MFFTAYPVAIAHVHRALRWSRLLHFERPIV
jgi:hypothetical protein